MPSSQNPDSNPAVPLQPAGLPDQQACANCDPRHGCSGCRPRCNLHSFDWLAEVPDAQLDTDIVEVHFKNTRRGFFRNTSHLDLHPGDLVAVEANPGHDIGEVALTGRLVAIQMKRVNLRPGTELLRVFRKAKPNDLERFEQAKARETDTMIRSRKIAADLGLKMKIGDVEYQGDGNKAIFYYIADERVDFRQLIKVLADTFKIRVEMKQIGARQEAGRIGGIGPCGRPLCCASWMTNFVSVATGAARYQDLSLNPQKLAGQCAKLKCCINFEVDTYVEASRRLPARDEVLITKDAEYFFLKADTLTGMVTYSTSKSTPANLVTISRERAFEVIALNRNGVKPDQLDPDRAQREHEEHAFGDILNQDAITRFDRKKKKKKKGGGDRQGDKASAADGHADKPQQPERRGDKPQQRGNNGNRRQRNDRQRQRREQRRPADSHPENHAGE